MTRLFFMLATVITVIFFVCSLVLFIAQWVIYHNVEKTRLNSAKAEEIDEGER